MTHGMIGGAEDEEGHACRTQGCEFYIGCGMTRGRCVEGRNEEYREKG